VRIGIGLNIGIVMLGTIGGTQRMKGTVLSDAVNPATKTDRHLGRFIRSIRGTDGQP